ncbi:MAG: YceI family protein [Acidobacteriota bacterium]|nr:YceI family protein [Acidobacteriota bacterium]
MRIHLVIAAIALCVVLSGCENPADDKAGAITGNANKEKVDVRSAGTGYVFSGADSSLEFVGSKVTGKEPGSFEKFKGKIDLVDDRVERSQVSFEIDMSSVKTDSKGLAEHLMTADFFNVERFPSASFVSTRVEQLPGNGGDSYQVTGVLDFHGVKKSISFPATIKINKDDIRAKGDFFINRRDFDVNYAGRANDLIRDEVVIILDIRARPTGMVRSALNES